LREKLESSGHTVRMKRIAPEGNETSEAGISFDLQRGVSKAVKAAIADWSFPLILSGNCLSALGVTAGLRSAGKPSAVCWLDAHADFNTPDSTVSGFLDGMVVATLTGRCWKSLASSIPGFAPTPEWQVVLIGARDLDPAEAVALDESTVRLTSLKDAGPVFDSIASDASSLYLHIDLDVFDPSVGIASSYAAPGGLTVEDVLGVLEAARRSFDIVATSMTAYDPVADPAGRIARAAVDIAQGLLH
jgi:arginase